tara:strand:- start:3888 stop:4964 length:1077 start_codon:yes stop_codon:yes gene_type:complete
MTDWFGEVAERKPVSKVVVWGLAILISLAANWWLAVKMESTFEQLAVRSVTPREAQRDIEIVMEPFEERFVEANPDVPSNTPDETVNFGAQNQQAAEADPDPAGESDFPERDSEMESQTFLERGDTSEQLQPGVYSEAAAETPPAEEAAGAVGDMAPRVERKTPEWIKPVEEGSGSRVPTAEEGGESPSEEENRRAGTISLDDGPQQSQKESESLSVNNPAARPMPRKKVGAEVLLAPLNQSKSKASRKGELAVNSRLTDYGEYTQRALEAIQAEWHRLIREVSLGPDSTYSSVTVVFSIDQTGSIAKTKIEKSTASELGSMICLDAIYARAPYGEWTEDMIRTLGEDTRVEITFHYR